MHELYFDGGICPHPNGGFACYFGWVIQKAGTVIKTGCAFEKCQSDIGSSGVELAALAYGMNDAIQLGISGLRVYGDSKTVIECLNGLCEQHNKIMLRGCDRIRELSSELTTVSFHWISRTQNMHADQLARQAYKKSDEMQTRAVLIAHTNSLYERLFQNTFPRHARQQWHMKLTGKTALAQMSHEEIRRVISATQEIATAVN